MKNEAHKDIDNIFRQALEDPAKEAGFRESDWIAMEKKLDADRRPRKIVYWLPLAATAAAVILVFLGWLFIKSGSDSNNQGQHPIAINKGDKIKPVTGKQDKRDQTVVATAPVDSSTKVNVPAALNFGPTHKTPVAANTTPPKMKTAAPLNTQNNNSQQPADETLLIANDRSENLQQGNPALPEVFSGEPVAALTPVDVLPETTNSTNNNTPGISKTVKKPTGWLKPQLAVTVLASSDINGASSFKSAGTGKNIGLLFSARFGKLSLSTGATYSLKPYTLPYSGYNPNSSYKFQYSPETVTADCRMIDIPFNIDYRVYSKNKNSITIGTGITSYIMTTESYTYNYSYPTSWGPSTYAVKNPDQYFLSALNLQVNYQRQINSKIGFNIQPYMKLPLKEIGYSQVRLQTAGIAVGLNWNINSPPSPK